MARKRYAKNKWSGLDNFQCRLCQYATTDKGLIIRHVRTEHPTEAEGADHPLTAIPFASDSAATLAVEEGLKPEDFATHAPTGAGGYVLQDVRAIVSGRNDK
jgi:hypothetical protein